MVAVTRKQKFDPNDPEGMNLPGLGATINAPAGPSQGQVKGGSGQFTNIQQYIDANRAKTKGLAEGITSEYKEDVDELGSGLKRIGDQYLGDAPSDFIKDRIKDAEQGVDISDEDVAKFREHADPTEPLPDLGSKAREAKDLLKRSKDYETPTGLFTGIQSLVGDQSSTYSSGQKQLDQLLLGGDRQARQSSIKDIREASQGLGTSVSDLDRSMYEAREKRKEEASGVDALSRTAEDTLTSKSNEQAQFDNMFTGDPSTLTPEQVNVLGLQNDTDQNLYGLDPKEYYNPNITGADLAQVNSLRRLAGKPPLTMAEASMSNELKQPGFDQNAFKAARLVKKTQYDTSLNELKNQLSRLKPGGGAYTLDEYNTVTARHKQALVDIRALMKTNGFSEDYINNYINAIPMHDNASVDPVTGVPVGTPPPVDPTTDPDYTETPVEGEPGTVMGRWADDPTTTEKPRAPEGSTPQSIANEQIEQYKKDRVAQGFNSQQEINDFVNGLVKVRLKYEQDARNKYQFANGGIVNYLRNHRYAR